MGPADKNPKKHSTNNNKKFLFCSPLQKRNYLFFELFRLPVFSKFNPVRILLSFDLDFNGLGLCGFR
jgi:hypothetical protein